MTDDNSDANLGKKSISAAYFSPLAVIALSFGCAVGWGGIRPPKHNVPVECRSRRRGNRTSDRYFGHSRAGFQLP